MATVQRNGDDYWPVAVTAGVVLKNRPGTLGAIVVALAGTTVVCTLYDNKVGDNSGEVLAQYLTADGKGPFLYGIPFKVGLSAIVTAGVIGTAKVVFQ